MLMVKVAVASDELNNNNFILARRGEFVANAPESPWKLCCENDILDLWVPFLGNIWNMCPKVIPNKMNNDFKVSRIGYN